MLDEHGSQYYSIWPDALILYRRSWRLFRNEQASAEDAHGAPSSKNCGWRYEAYIHHRANHVVSPASRNSRLDTDLWALARVLTVGGCCVSFQLRSPGQTHGQTRGCTYWAAAPATHAPYHRIVETRDRVVNSLLHLRTLQAGLNRHPVLRNSVHCASGET